MKKSFLFFALCLQIPALADPQVLTLRSAVESALSQNSSAKSNRIAVKQGEEAYRYHQAAWQPTLSAAANVGHEQSLNSRSYQTSWGANVSLVKQWKGSTGAQVKAQEHTLQALRAEASSNDESLIAAITSAYLHALRDSSLVAMHVENVTTQELKLSQIVAFVQAGTLAPGDSLQQQAVVAQARLSLVQADLTYRNALSDLCFQMGLDSVPATLSVQAISAEQLSRILLLDPSLPSHEDSSAYNAELEARRQRILSAQSALLSAQRSYWPTFQVGASVSTTTPILVNPETSTNKGSSQSLQLSAQVQVPILDQHDRAYQVVSAKLTLESAQLEQQKSLQSQSSATSSAARQLISAQKSLQAAHISEIAAQQSLSDMQGRFSQGSVSLLDLKSSEEDAREAARTRINAEYALWDAFLDWSISKHQIRNDWQILAEVK